MVTTMFCDAGDVTKEGAIYTVVAWDMYLAIGAWAAAAAKAAAGLRRPPVWIREFREHLLRNESLDACWAAADAAAGDGPKATWEGHCITFGSVWAFLGVELDFMNEERFIRTDYADAAWAASSYIQNALFDMTNKANEMSRRDIHRRRMAELDADREEGLREAEEEQRSIRKEYRRNRPRVWQHRGPMPAEGPAWTMEEAAALKGRMLELAKADPAAFHAFAVKALGETSRMLVRYMGHQHCWPGFAHPNPGPIDTAPPRAFRLMAMGLNEARTWASLAERATRARSLEQQERARASLKGLLRCAVLNERSLEESAQKLGFLTRMERVAYDLDKAWGFIGAGPPWKLPYRAPGAMTLGAWHLWAAMRALHHGTSGQLWPRIEALLNAA